MPLESAVQEVEAARLKRLADASTALGLNLDGPQLLKLMAYLQLLQRWNRVYNLTALRDPDQMLSHHLVDCLAAVPALQRWAADRSALAVASTTEPVGSAGAHTGHAANTGAGRQNLRILDVGSGGGLPGVVLAILSPHWQVHCVDTVAKKASFIKQAAAELRLPQLLGVHARVEAMGAPAGVGAGTCGGPTPGQTYDLITSRAFASLGDFVSLTAHLLAPQGVWMAMKGKSPDDEVSALPAGVEVFHVEQLQVPGLDAQRCLVWMRPQGA